VSICAVCVNMGKEWVYVPFVLTWGKSEYMCRLWLHGERGGIYPVFVFMRERGACMCLHGETVHAYMSTWGKEDMYVQMSLYEWGKW
jgi:hypothetical protein